MKIDLRQLPSLEQIERELSRRACAESLAEFVRQAWHVVEPATPLVWGWALDAICEHLEAVTNGDITRLLMNVPPGSMKSLLTGVFWPAWEWGPKGMPHMRFVGTAHEEQLAIRDSRKCRDLIKSEWFQDRWKLPLDPSLDGKREFGNMQRGVRQARAFTSMTGVRGDRVILDDPISADNANSDAKLEAARIAFTETLPTRVNNENSAIVVIMQRLNERDTSGVILDMGLPYVHLSIPMRYEPENHCRTVIGWEDPRTVEGELMFPERFGEQQVSELEATLGSYGAAGQLQQRPVPRSGGLFNREWFKFLPEPPTDIAQIARGWDLAATVSNTAAYTAGVKIAKTRDGKIVIMDCKRERLSPNGVRSLIKTTAIADTSRCRVSIPKDPGQAAKGQVEQFSQDLMGFDCRFTPETGDKMTRAVPLAAQAEAGNVYLVEGAWNAAFLDEVCMFPNGKFKDQTDAASRAFSEVLALGKMNSGLSPAFGPKILG